MMQKRMLDGSIKHNEPRALETKDELKAPITISVYEYDQNSLFKNINACFSLQGISEVSDMGHCHGLAALWLKRRMENCAHYFKRIVRQTVECPKEKLLTLCGVINKFYKDVCVAQEPKNQRKSATIIDEKEIPLPSIERDKEFHEKDFIDFLQKKLPVGSGLLIRSVTSKKHTVAVYRAGANSYELYDSNFKDGEELHCTQHEIYSDIRDSFYKAFSLAIPSAMPLEIDIIQPRPRLIAVYPRPLLFTSPSTPVGIVPSLSSFNLATLAKM